MLKIGFLLLKALVLPAQAKKIHSKLAPSKRVLCTWSTLNLAQIKMVTMIFLKFSTNYLHPTCWFRLLFTQWAVN